MAAGTLLVFSPAVHFDFVHYDDPQCVTAEPMVAGGLTWAGVKWAFTSAVLGHWKPLVSLSHMADCEWFGLEPGAHHAVNIFWHAATVVMLFFALRRLTGATWRSALVAGLFAWHPLRVESVAWVTERKDVISGFFWMLTLWCYAGYARQPGRRRYLATLGAFGLGLMSKSILVTLPCVLLLLDAWPLRRARVCLPRLGLRLEGPAMVPWSRLLMEKLPFFVLAAVVAVVTYRLSASAGNLTEGDAFALPNRIANALAGCWFYLEKLVWPGELCALYPLVPPASSRVLLGLAAVVGGTVAAGLCLRRAPFLAVGWLWFLGVLAPVIGIVQAGIQGAADRYTYLPHIGLFIALSWGAEAWLGPARRRWLEVGAAVLLVWWAALTARHLHYWHDSLTLFQRIVDLTEDNARAYHYMGHSLHWFGQPQEAVRLFERGTREMPGDALIRFNLGLSYDRVRRTNDALAQYRIAVRLNPELAVARHQLGQSLLDRRELAAAETQLLAARVSNPSDPETPLALARLRLQQGRTNDAQVHLQGALTIMPDFPAALALQATFHRQAGRLREARECADRAVALQPDRADFQSELAEVLLAQGRPDEAFSLWQEISLRAPDRVAIVGRFAWVLATHPEAKFRQPQRALALAEAAAARAKADAVPWDVLGAALAANARYPEAEAAATRALELAATTGNSTLAAAIAVRRDAYRRQEPHFDARLAR